MPIYTRIQIEEFVMDHIRGYVTDRYFYGHCPFHSDRSSSFSLYWHSGVWTCYSGCGRGTFNQLREKLGDVYVIPLPQHNIQPQDEVNLEDLNKAIPSWFLDRGFNLDICQRWGLVSDDEGKVYIPVYDMRQEYVGYIVRQFGGKPKYRYSSKFPRGNVLFGEHKVKKERIVYLVEGQLDAIWGWEAGMPTVALGGSYLSDGQLEKLKQFPNLEMICLTLDNDDVGREQSYVVAGRLASLGIPIFCFYWDKAKKDFNDYSLEQLREKIKDSHYSIF